MSQSTITTRPPGLTTRASSANARGLSGMCESDSIAIAASKRRVGQAVVEPVADEQRRRRGAAGAARGLRGESVSPVTVAPRSRASSRAVAP